MVAGPGTGWGEQLGEQLWGGLVRLGEFRNQSDGSGVGGGCRSHADPFQVFETPMHYPSDFLMGRSLGLEL